MLTFYLVGVVVCWHFTNFASTDFISSVLAPAGLIVFAVLILKRALSRKKRSDNGDRSGGDRSFVDDWFGGDGGGDGGAD